MAVITVSRKFGSDGGYIAKQVAQNLGYHFVDKDFIRDVLRDYRTSFFSEYDHLPSFWEQVMTQSGVRRREMANMLDRVIRALAHHGNVVILGRSGYDVLGDYADVLNVRIQAPLDFRVKQVIKRKEVSANQAKEIIKQSDKMRSEFVKTFYGVEWETSSAFDMVINTSKVAPEKGISWIVEAAKAIEAKEEEDDKPTTASMDVDSVMAKAVSSELECKAAHRQ
jgi:cytidylate kinase